MRPKMGPVMLPPPPVNAPEVGSCPKKWIIEFGEMKPLDKEFGEKLHRSMEKAMEQAMWGPMRWWNSFDAMIDRVRFVACVRPVWRVLLDMLILR